MIQDPRKAFSEALVEIGRKYPNVLALSCDSGSGSGMNDFKKEDPGRLIEVGISEQTAMDIAAGLALNGFIPVISAIAPFISMRCYEQIRNDVGYANTNVKIIGSSSGLSHSQAGSSHQANEDIALLRTIPNMVVLNPGDGFEVKQTLIKAVEHVGPVYIRMPRHKLEDILPSEQRSFEIGKSELLSEGEIMIFASGTVVNEAKRAAVMLNKDGYSIGVVNMPTVKPLDDEVINKYARKSRLLISIEEHAVIGGLGSAIAECIASLTGSAPLHMMGIASGAHNTGPYRELLQAYGLTDTEIYKRILSLI